MSIPDGDDLGNPKYPAPWTTSLPREGLRDTDQARIISLAPDVCKSPTVPVPYPVVDFCGHDENYTPSVRFTGQKAMVMRSNTSHVHGDEAGVGKGVKSGTVGGISEPITHAAQVRAEGSHVIRHLDRFWMNNRNTIGEAVFIRDIATYPAPEDDDPWPGSMVAYTGSFEPVQVAQAATGTMTDAGGGVLGGSSAGKPATDRSTGASRGLKRRGVFGRSLAVELADALTFGKVTQRQIETILGGLDYYGTTPDLGLSAAGMNVFAQAAALVREQALPAGDYDLARAIEARVPDIVALDPGDGLRGLSDEEIRQRLLGKTEIADPVPEEPEPERPGVPVPPLGTGTRVDEDIDSKRCPWIVICFMPKTADYDPGEFQRQLSEQETALQNLQPAQYIGNRSRILADGTTEIARNSPRAKRAYREIWYQYGNENPGYPRDGSLAALHALDIVAGGDPANYLRIGPQRENRIMGNQWAQGKGVEGGDRLHRLDAHATRLQANGCPKMNARLRVCPGRGLDAEGKPL